ncbi:hypothetical protein [Streptococcus mitis]|uniref:hypothetical protein n=1 Tax=Streptococcus mitis TaxID=28037 RepID=UPI0012909F7C|nr:hypothetical protein [Streptococcus mitis]MQQ32638.1 hypothetical protein [Streptococcus mitis]DAN62027.1 MAG TPA: hypothetical protein [Caudoviricetes sp.]
MYEPPLISQLLGTGFLVLGFIGAGILARQMELHELEKRRKQEEEDTRAVNEFNKIVEIGRKIERQEIRKNIRREFQGFTFDNERPEGLKPEPLALPEPKKVIMKVLR